MHINLFKAAFDRRFALLITYGAINGTNIIFDKPSWDTAIICPIDIQGDYLDEEMARPLMNQLGEFWESLGGKRDGNKFYME